MSNIFNEFVAQVLIELGEKHILANYNDIANFITIIFVWWQILNVKYDIKDIRMNNKYQTPLTYDKNDKLFFTDNFVTWLDE